MTLAQIDRARRLRKVSWWRDRFGVVSLAYAIMAVVVYYLDRTGTAAFFFGCGLLAFGAWFALAIYAFNMEVEELYHQAQQAQTDAPPEDSEEDEDEEDR